jgi:PD-(D/E)XK endonuclease
MDKDVNIQHAKELGEWAEMRFMARAAENGLRVTKPYGESAPYDFIVEHNRKFLRVQVKATRSKHSNSYYCHVRRSGRTAYTKEDIDFIAAYLVTRDIWYIIPLEKTGSDSIVLSPDLATSKHAAYREAWHLLQAGENQTQGPSTSLGMTERR